MLKEIISKSRQCNHIHIRTLSTSSSNYKNTTWKKKGNIHEEEYIRKLEDKKNKNKEIMGTQASMIKPPIETKLRGANSRSFIARFRALLVGGVAEANEPSSTKSR